MLVELELPGKFQQPAKIAPTTYEDTWETMYYQENFNSQQISPQQQQKTCINHDHATIS